MEVFGSARIEGNYRYWLTRSWFSGMGDTKPGDDIRAAGFVMLNPSTADGETDDLTIKKCMGFARQWGCFGIYVANLFPYRATDPSELNGLAADVLLGNDLTDFYLKSAVELAALYRMPLIAAWGSTGSKLPDRNVRIVRLMQIAAEKGVSLECLGTTAQGDPRHPSRLPYATERTPWTIPS